MELENYLYHVAVCTFEHFANDRNRVFQWQFPDMAARMGFPRKCNLGVRVHGRSGCGFRKWVEVLIHETGYPNALSLVRRSRRVELTPALVHFMLALVSLKDW